MQESALDRLKDAAKAGAQRQPPVTFTPDVSAEDAPEVIPSRGENSRVSIPRPLKDGHSKHLVEFQASLAEVDAASTAKGAVIGIEYLDSKRQLSLRRIRINRVYDRDGCLYISAFCFERMAPRHFCVGNIQSIFDVNGEVFEDVHGYLRDVLGIPVPDGIAPPQSPATLLKEILPLCSDDLAVLVALARCDGELHRKEVTAIVEYCANIAYQNRVRVNHDHRDALRVYIARLYPDAEMVEDFLRDGVTPGFLQAAEKVIRADGKIAPEEAAFSKRIKGKRCVVDLPWQPAHDPQPPEDWEWIVPYAFRSAMDYVFADGAWTVGEPQRFSFKAGDILHHRSGLFSVQVKQAEPDSGETSGLVMFRAFEHSEDGIQEMYEVGCSQHDFAACLQYGGLLDEEDGGEGEWDECIVYESEA